ncbi:MAG: LysR substrate-binding domain-containing protein [Gemmobacter sp.]
MRHFETITIKQLRGLAAVVDQGGVTAAAEVLGLTPPAVSTQLRTLEANIGTPVLRRDEAGRMVPTAAGVQVLATARRVFRALDDCRGQLKALRSGAAGMATLGVVSTGKYFAPRIVALARRVMPQVTIALRIGNREETVAALAEGAIDLAVMGRPPAGQAVEAAPLGPHPYVMIVAPDHPLAGACDVPPQAILGEMFLQREAGSGSRLLVERFLEEIGSGHGFETLEFASNETIKQGVIAGLGVAIISAHTVVGEIETGRLALVGLRGLPVARQWYVVSAAGRERSPTAAAVARFLFEQRDAYLPRFVWPFAAPDGPSEG